MPGAPAAPPPAVAVEDLVVDFGPLRAVDGVSMVAEPGEVVALLGPNGAGKTTTVETLEGYRSPTCGRVAVLGLDPRRDRADLAPRLGVMLQQGGFYPSMNAVDLLALFSSYYDSPEDPAGLLDLLGLTSVRRTPWRRLSGGEQRRLSLAIALVGRPDVAFLDEPTSGVDIDGRLVVREVIASLAGRGACVVLATHELDEAERTAHRVVIVHHGRVVAAGTPAGLLAEHGVERLEDVFLAAIGRSPS